LLQTGTSGLLGKGIKRSTFGVRKSEVKVTRHRNEVWRPGEGMILRSCIPSSVLVLAHTIDSAGYTRQCLSARKKWRCRIVSCRW